MADDQQFDPFSQGILTPQSVQLQRLAMMMEAQKQAQMNGQQNAGMAYANQSMGLGLGQALGNLANAHAGPGYTGNLLDRIAGQNQQAINAASQDAQGGGGAGTGGPSSGGNGASGGGQQLDPVAQQIMMMRGLSQRLAANGNYQGAQAATDKANMLTQMRLTMGKTSQDIAESQSKEVSNYATANMDQARQGMFRADTFGKTADVPLGDGRVQTNMWNPDSSSYDRPLGKPYIPTASNPALKGQDAVNSNALQQLELLYNAALPSQKMLRNISDAEGLMNRPGGIITGSLSETRQNVGNLLATFGINTGKGQAALDNTAAFETAMKQSGLSLAKGTFSRITQWETQMMQAIGGGNTDMAMGRLKAIVEELKTEGVRPVQQYNDYLSQLGKDPQLGERVRSTHQALEIPADGNVGAPPASMLKEGVHTSFKNGQVWTRSGGVPVRVK